MTRDAPIDGLDRSGGSYRVRSPQAGDAIGSALRDAYREQLALPSDMAALLRKIGPRPATTRDIGN